MLLELIIQQDKVEGYFTEEVGFYQLKRNTNGYFNILKFINFDKDINISIFDGIK